MRCGLVTIDWETTVTDLGDIDHIRDLVRPCEQLLEFLAEHGVRATFFCDVAEILAVRRTDPATALELENQLGAIAEQGHDLQLHFHPRWAARDSELATWDGLPLRHEDVGEVDLRGYQETLRDSVRVLSEYVSRVVAYRAGNYAIEPLSTNVAELRSLGIVADCSMSGRMPGRSRLVREIVESEGDLPPAVFELGGDMFEVPIPSIGGSSWDMSARDASWAMLLPRMLDRFPHVGELQTFVMMGHANRTVWFPELERAIAHPSWQELTFLTVSELVPLAQRHLGMGASSSE